MSKCNPGFAKWNYVPTILALCTMDLLECTQANMLSENGIYLDQGYEGEYDLKMKPLIQKKEQKHNF